MNFVALDFETANNNRHSVCEVGLSFVENGEIINTRSWLVRPKDNYYLPFNVSIHGITPEDTLKELEFDVVWEEIRPLI
jgi:DNA polymerase-3 subunit epsilon